MSLGLSSKYSRKKSLKTKWINCKTSSAKHYWATPTTGDPSARAVVPYFKCDNPHKTYPFVGKTTFSSHSCFVFHRQNHDVVGLCLFVSCCNQPFTSCAGTFELRLSLTDTDDTAAADDDDITDDNPDVNPDDITDARLWELHG